MTIKRLLKSCAIPLVPKAGSYAVTVTLVNGTTLTAGSSLQLVRPPFWRMYAWRWYSWSTRTYRQRASLYSWWYGGRSTRTCCRLVGVGFGLE